MRYRHSIAILGAISIGAVAVALLTGRLAEAPTPEAGLTTTRVIDPVGFIPATDVSRFNEYLAYIRNESNIDIWLVLGRPQRGSTMESTAIDLVQRLGIGRQTGAQRGLLLYFDLDSRRLKVEVGYGLEAYFPDAYIALLVDRHAPLLFASQNRSADLRLLLRLLQARIRDAALGGDFDPAPYSNAPSGPLSGGAGATNDLTDPSRARLPRASGMRQFVAGSSPRHTYDAYLGLLSSESWQPDADLFTEESREYLRQFPLSRAYRDFILIGEYGKTWRLDVRGDRAILYFTSTPFASPHFFVKQGDVWRFDLIAEVRNTKERVGGPLTWSYEGSDDPYTSVFSDLLAEVQGYRRIASGDNRPLPTTATPAQ